MQENAKPDINLPVTIQPVFKGRLKDANIKKTKKIKTKDKNVFWQQRLLGRGYYANCH